MFSKKHYLPELAPWSFGPEFIFDSDFIKLRDISFTYSVPMHNTAIKNLNLSVYSNNIILWTKAKAYIDPENAYQPANGRFIQGVERYNVRPWVIPVGFKVQLTF